MKDVKKRNTLALRLHKKTPRLMFNLGNENPVRVLKLPLTGAVGSSPCVTPLDMERLTN
jgi:hypothetical protein